MGKRSGEERVGNTLENLFTPGSSPTRVEHKSRPAGMCAVRERGRLSEVNHPPGDRTSKRSGGSAEPVPVCRDPLFRFRVSRSPSLTRRTSLRVLRYPLSSGDLSKEGHPPNLTRRGTRTSAARLKPCPDDLPRRRGKAAQRHRAISYFQGWNTRPGPGPAISRPVWRGAGGCPPRASRWTGRACGCPGYRP